MPIQVFIENDRPAYFSMPLGSVTNFSETFAIKFNLLSLLFLFY